MIYWSRSLFKSHKKTEIENYERYYEQFNSFLSKHNAKLILFEYFYKYFGSMRLKFEYKGKIHICEYEKGQIFLDEKLMDGGACYFPEGNDRMVEIIDTMIFALG